MAIRAGFSHSRLASGPTKFVITGFNTDVEFGGVVYHVQTEDKGLDTPYLLTLVYDGGTILARKQQPYEDLFANGFDESELETRLNRQHSLVCAAIKAGRIDDLIALTRRETKRKTKKPKKAKSLESAKPMPGYSGELASPIPRPTAEIRSKSDAAVTDNLPVVDVLSVIEDEAEIPIDAVEIISHMAGSERRQHNRLSIEFINESPFRGGEHKTVTFMVCRGTDRKVVGNAQILVKILGSNLRPQIFHSVTDQNGLAKMELDLPHFSAGRAAFLVRASDLGEETEIRRAIINS